jgi:hypothetical protein
MNVVTIGYQSLESGNMQLLPKDDPGLGKEAPSAIALTNEKLEKAIEQLRHANEALQATGEALGALNHQLERMGEEVESLSREVLRLRLRGTG